MFALRDSERFDTNSMLQILGIIREHNILVYILTIISAEVESVYKFYSDNKMCLRI